MSDEERKLSKTTLALLEAKRLRASWEEKRASATHINVSSLVGVFPFMYERVRTLVEFPEEHLISRRAIERILRRRLAFSNNRGDEFSKAFIHELITARYIKNNFVPDTAVAVVTALIARYEGFSVALLEAKEAPYGWKDRCISFAARDIEAHLCPRFEEEALAKAAVDIIKASVVLPNVPEDIQKLLLQVAVRKAILKDDEEGITLALLKMLVPEYETSTDSASVGSAVLFIERLRAHPLLPFLVTRVRTLRPLFLMFQATVQSVDEGLLKETHNEDELSVKIQELIALRFTKARAARYSAMLRSLLYIFLTKVVLLLAVELPYEGWYTGGGIPKIPLGINLIAPPLFMIVLTGGVRRPKPSVIGHTIDELQAMLYEGRLTKAAKQLMRTMKAPRHPFLKSFFWALYALFSVTVLALVGWGLVQLNFSPLGLVIFYSFLGLVGFFGFRIRATFAEVVPFPLKESWLVTVLDIILLPFVNLGRYLARTFARINVIVAFLDMLIEVPFKAFFSVTEDWLSFMKEKKDEITRDN